MQKGENKNMKQRSLLMLLPFALLVTGCSGNLKKGNIFNAKFMKQNFASAPEEVSYEYKAPEKIDLNFGEGVTSVTKTIQSNDILKVEKGDIKGLFCLETNSFAIPLSEELTTLHDVITPNNQGVEKLRFYSGKKTVDDKVTRMVFDDYGNKLYEGAIESPLGVGLSHVNRYLFDGKEYIQAKIILGDATVAYAYYNIDRSFKEVITREEFYKRNPYEEYGDSLVEFGHKELRYKAVNVNGETRVSVYNTKKGKYVSSFVIPQAAEGTSIVGDSIIYQIRDRLPDRATKYDVNINEAKYNISTYSVSYLNGKSRKINTKLYLGEVAFKTEQKNEKGIKKFLYLEQVRQITKDKTLSNVQKDLIVNEKLKVKADVTGINYRSLKLFDKEHLISNNKVIYDFKLKETGVIGDLLEKNIVRVSNRYTLVDHTGKYLVAPIYRSIKLVAENKYYILETEEAFKFAKVEGSSVSFLGEVLKSEYEEADESTKVGSFAKFKVYIQKSDSEKVMFDVTSGQKIEMVKPLEGSASISTMDPKVEHYTQLAESLKLREDVYEKDGSYYAIRYYQKVTFDFPSMK